MTPAAAFCSLCALALPALSQTARPAAWDARSAPPQTARLQIWRGDTVPLAPDWGPSDTNGWSFTAYWSTNNADWWSKSLDPAASPSIVGDPFLWTPDMDAGARRYRLFIRASDTVGASYRANAEIAMLDSPGTSPASLPPPSAWPALAAELLPFTLPHLPTYEQWTNLAARVEEVASAAPTGTVSSVSSDTALRLVSEEAGWWVSVEAGTATLWRVQIDGSNLLYQIGENFQDHLGARPPATSYPHPFTDGAWQSMAGGGGYGIINTASGAMWFGGPGAYPLLLEPQDERAEGTATFGWIAQTSTNAVGTYVTALDLTAAIEAYIPAAVTQALDVAQAAFASSTNAQAQVQAVDLRLSAATNHIVKTYFASSNAWIEVDYSNKTAAVVMVGESGTNSVLLSEAGASLDPDATNSIWIAISQNYTALSNALALKADAAWGQYAPDGTPNPEPDYMLWLNRPATMFASGYTWATYGTYAALTADGTVAFESGGEGSLRIGPDPANHFGYAVGGSVIVGARTDSLTVYDGGTSNGYAEIIYDYEGGGFPVAWFTPSLSVAFTEIPAAQWADNLDGTATLTVPATGATGFWRATTTAEIDSVFVSTMPARFDGGVLGGTNALPVIFDSVIQIESGGKTYRIPAQEVE